VASPEDTLAAAKKNLDDASGVTIGLSTPQLPSGVTGLLKADGVATHDPAFKGSIKVAASGITADASVVAVDGVVYAKLPFTSRFVKIDPADYGAPDPANLMNPDSGFSSLLTAAENVKKGDSVRDGKVVLSSFTGTVPGQDVKAVIPSAKASADFDARFTVDDQNRLAEARLTGPFYPEAGDVSYRVTFDDYGSKPTITKP
jgi:lipoprotein LprG